MRNSHGENASAVAIANVALPVRIVAARTSDLKNRRGKNRINRNSTTAIGTALSALGGGMDRFDNLHGSIKEAIITIEGGRVTHKLPLQTDRLGTWVFDGELGIADQRFSYLNLDLPTSIFNSKDLARYVGDHITFPFSGPINRPTLAKDFLVKFTKENLLKGGGLPNLLRLL